MASKPKIAAAVNGPTICLGNLGKLKMIPMYGERLFTEEIDQKKEIWEVGK